MPIFEIDEARFDRALGQAEQYGDILWDIVKIIALYKRAAKAVLQSTDWEASSYESQHPVEDWALDALKYALDGDVAAAEAILNKYENEVFWEVRKQYKADWRANE